MTGNSAKINPRSWLTSEVPYAVVSIVVVTYLAYGLFFVPAIYADDWPTVIRQTAADELRWLDLSHRRPLLDGPLLIQNFLFGLNVTAYYLVLGVLHVLWAIVLYLIANQFQFMRRYSFGLIFALLFLIYPTNYTNMWLVQVGIYYAVCLTLLYGYFLLRFSINGRWLTLGLALICLLISLGIYEAQLGVVCVWSLILIAVQHEISAKRRLGLLTPIVLAGGFALWRMFGYQAIGINDDYLAQVSLTPGVLLDRLILGYKISLVWGWTNTPQQLLPWMAGTKIIGLLLMGMTLAMWWVLSRTISRPRDPERNSEFAGGSPGQRWLIIRPYVLSALIGLILIGAGYIPVAAVFLPNLSGMASRFNIIANVGSAVFLTSVLMIGSLLFARNRGQIKYLFLASAVPFLVLGILTQALVQYDSKVAWQEQQLIWQELFSAAPNFKDDTTVLLILPGYQDRAGYQNWRRTPLHAWWEVTGATQILYNNHTLSGEIVFPDVEVAIVEPTLKVEGIVNQHRGTVTPYGQAVAFEFNRDSNTLRQLDELPAELVQGAATPVELCSDCVLSERLPPIPLRKLVLENYGLELTLN